MPCSNALLRGLPLRPKPREGLRPLLGLVGAPTILDACGAAGTSRLPACRPLLGLCGGDMPGGLPLAAGTRQLRPPALPKTPPATCCCGFGCGGTGSFPGLDALLCF